jgi:hypothetical protein
VKISRRGQGHYLSWLNVEIETAPSSGCVGADRSAGTKNFIMDVTK